jgi:hypothetical protein
MNTKIGIALVSALVLGLMASAFYVVPTLAYMNGDTDQTQDQDMNRIQDRDCLRDCYRIQDQDQTRGSLCLQECAQSQLGTESTNAQYRYEHQYQNQRQNAPQS